MRSLYLAIFAVMLGVLSLSYVVFRSISNRVERAYFDPVFERFDRLEMESARNALEAGGNVALSAYLRKLDTMFGGLHYLTNERGIDVVSGTDLSSKLPRPPASNSRLEAQDRMVITQRSEDGRFWLIAVAPVDRSGPSLFLNYYLLIAGVMLVLYWLAAFGLVIPIRRVSKTADQFGRGDFAVRVELGRKDEIGSLAQSFNQMADRIEVLITSQQRLLQDISHELRSPLTRLKLATKLARTAPDQQAAMDRIEKDVNRMSVLIADLLEITRMESDPTSLAVAEFDLELLIRAILNDCSIEVDARGCRFEVSGEIRSQVAGNRELLLRAIENVVRNAVRYSPRGETIDVHLHEESRYAVIEIRDRGPGVEEQFLGAIFDPFFRTDMARDVARGGAGLGLSIARRAVQLHRGRIEAENAGPGLRVRIALPIEDRL